MHKPVVGFQLRADSDALLSESEVETVVAACWQVHGGPHGVHIEVVFLDEAEHCELHAQFLNDPTPTDVMAFPYGDDDLFGEVLVNVEMAVRTAPDHAWSAREECALYIAHGCLHLLGFDDQSETDRAAMRVAEGEVMSVLQLED